MKIKRECKSYIPTYFFPDIEPGSDKQGFRCEDLEKQTFPDEIFDLVITQDVFEHVFDPSRALREVRRTLKPGGAHVFTVPWYQGKQTLIRAVREGEKVNHILQPQYHGSPIDNAGSLVVREWGDDLFDFIERNSHMKTSAVDMFDKRLGIEGKFREVFISRK